jgi:hypothetical protein
MKSERLMTTDVISLFPYWGALHVDRARHLSAQAPVQVQRTTEVRRTTDRPAASKNEEHR